MAVDEIYKLYASGLKGKSKATIDQMACDTWLSCKDRTFGFSRTLLNQFKNNGFLILLVSASPLEMINKFGESFAVDRKNLMSGELEVADGIYTGKIISYPGSSDQKVEAVNRIVNSRNLEVDWAKSVAMGDDERDLELMRMVGFAILFEPNERLKVKAEELAWNVVDRSNILTTVNSFLSG